MLRFYLLALLAIPSAVHASETFTARVVGISNGDTITVLTVGNQQRKIRLGR